jgi:hypothetical protein
MRRALSLIVATVIAIIVSAAPGQAGPQPTVPAKAWNATGMINKVDDRHYYRRHGAAYWHRYYRPVAPAVPVRPLSCGEFRFWDGERCVDVRVSAPQARTIRGRRTVR